MLSLEDCSGLEEIVNISIRRRSVELCCAIDLTVVNKCDDNYPYVIGYINFDFSLPDCEHIV